MAKRTSNGGAGNTPKRARSTVGKAGKPPKKYRARVRMYRHGLGDCFLLSFPRAGSTPVQILIDCGALARDAAHMTRLVESIRDTLRAEGDGNRARLDVVVATHEHKDHLSGFNQARDVFSDDIEIGSVWLGWTENLSKNEVKKIKEARKKAAAKLWAALASPLALGAGEALGSLGALLEFSRDDDDTPKGRIADALEYLKLRGKDAGDLRYLEPGSEPFGLDGVDGVRVYVLGPPRDPILLKSSEVTEQMTRDGTIYHLAATGELGVEALGAAISAAAGLAGPEEDRYYPFASEHRIAPKVPDPASPGRLMDNPYYECIRPFLEAAYDRSDQAWRRIDHDWASALGQLALDLDNDTNNTSLVLAFEFAKGREVLLFVGDAQVGNWQSWAKVEFKVDGKDKPVKAHDLLARTVFYKVGHHCSHNATLKKGGLELMDRDDLVAFIPLDQETAKKQGKHGWDMPAKPLFKELRKRTGGRVVISDVSEPVPPEAIEAGIVATPEYVDYFLV